MKLTFHALALRFDGGLLLTSLSFILCQIFITHSVFFNWLRKMVNNRYPKYSSIQDTALQNLAQDLFHAYRTEKKYFFFVSERKKGIITSAKYELLNMKTNHKKRRSGIGHIWVSKKRRPKT